MPFSLAKINDFFFVSIIAMLAVTFVSCQREISGQLDTPSPPDLLTKITSSVSGFVIDENDLAVNGATVNMGGIGTLTDKYGFFEIKNVQVTKDAAVVTVTQPAYFKSIKTYIATEGKSAFFRIKLLPKNKAGNIDAAAGGNVTLSNGLNISVPANAVINATTKAAYTGQVSVLAHWISPLGKELNLIMPGDLRGLDTSGNLKLLTTYGMAAIELTGNGGELLQIGNGKKATITIPLHPSLSASAPATIPLWYFDETKGLWKEEGTAVKSGNSYIGAVSHFSFWNYDVPSNFVKFNCTITNAKGVPIQNVLVKVSVVSNRERTGFGYTDSAGYTGGAVPNNAQLLLEVFSEANCSNALFSQNFTTTTANVALGNIKVANASIAEITGNIVDCSNAPISNGFVIMAKTGTNYRYQVDKTGAFSFATPLCSGNTDVTFSAEDYTALQGGSATLFKLVQGVNFVGSLNACGVSILEYINYTINGTSYFMAAPDVAQSSGNPPYINVKGYSNTNSAAIYFANPAMAVGTTGSLSYFNTRQITDSTRILTPINVMVTEYGAIGQFLAGNFTGILTGAPPANLPYNVTCRFRVRRTQ
ncbi:MAG: hypothetical protein ABIN01_08625 [Ferruginibacter sp.]